MNTITSIVYSVQDLDSAKAIQMALLGTPPTTDEPYYVGFTADGIEIGLAPQQGNASPIVYVGVEDLDAALSEVIQAGATVLNEPHDVGGGTRIATVTDLDGNTLGLIHHR